MSDEQTAPKLPEKAESAKLALGPGLAGGVKEARGAQSETQQKALPIEPAPAPPVEEPADTKRPIDWDKPVPAAFLLAFKFAIAALVFLAPFVGRYVPGDAGVRAPERPAISATIVFHQNQESEDRAAPASERRAPAPPPCRTRVWRSDGTTSC